MGFVVMLRRSRFYRFSVALLCVILAVLSVSCGSPPPKAPPSAEVRLAAAEYALSQAYVIQQYFSACEGMSNETREVAEGLSKRWHIDNWGYVSVAAHEYRTHVAEWSRLYGRMASLVNPVELQLKLDKQHERKLFRITKHFGNRDGRCLRALNELLAVNYFIKDAPVHGEILQYLAKQHTQALAPFKVLTTYRQGLDASLILQGRMLVKAEQQAQAYCEGVEKTKVMVLDRPGSEEYYGVQCEDKRVAAVRCEFGRCAIDKSR
jgi:hypothetical protein